MDVFIFRDDIFEGEEDFMVSFEAFRLPDGSTSSTMTGVVVNPRSTRVIIEDANSENTSRRIIMIIVVRYSRDLSVCPYYKSRSGSKRRARGATTLGNII